MEYTEEQIKRFATQQMQILMNEPIVDTSYLLNVEVGYQLSGAMKRDSEAIRNVNRNSRLFQATFEEVGPVKSLKR